MPTVLRWRGYRFFFYSHEPNEPAHVHIDRAGATAKFWLEPVRLARNIGYSPAQLRTIHRAVEQHRQTLIEAWHGYFGA